MPTSKPRFSVAIDDDLLKSVDDYKFENRLKSQNQAINELVRAGLEELRKRDSESIKKASESAEANSKAMEKDTVEIFKDVLGRAGLLGENQDISDSDLEFLKAMFLAIKAHFKESGENRN
jgi:uncharacterized protein YllA (UPF0747 family)|nr:MAG TPA: PUTATIVE NICKEL-RESPONSIVE REGULATOR FACTOR, TRANSCRIPTION REGULATION, RHH [Caudoviricetes sp.]